MEKLFAAILSLIMAIIAVFNGATVPSKPGDTEPVTDPVVVEEPVTDDPVIDEPEDKEYEYDIYGDVAYGKHERQRFGIAIPKGMTGENGLILFIHGGGWVAGDRSGYTKEAIYWAKKGVATAALNYRYLSDSLFNKVTGADILGDVCDCVNAIYEFGMSKGIKFTRLMTCGQSAGAQLALMYAYSSASAPGAIKHTCVCSVCGPSNLLSWEFLSHPYTGDEDSLKMLTGYNPKKEEAKFYYSLQSLSPVTWVNANTVPTIILQGEQDMVISTVQATTLADKLDQYGVENELILFPNSGHCMLEMPASSADPEISEYALSVMEDYFNRFVK